MHRDIKPINFAINHKERQLKLFDFGLGEYYFPDYDYNLSVGTLYFKSPELFVGVHTYHYSFDIWGIGVVMAGMLFRKDPFFKAKDDFKVLKKIASYLGTEDLYKYEKRYNASLEDEEMEEMYMYDFEKVPWEDLINKENEHLISRDGLDLLRQMLVYDHNERIAARDAMEH